MNAVLGDINPRAVLGANNPPTPIDEARPVWDKVSRFLKDNPVVETEAHAIAANDVLTVAKTTIKGLEAAEKAEAEPLYSIWKAAKAKYKPAIDGMEKIADELAGRIKAFMLAEQTRRQREADEKRRLAEEAERAAREAERLEQEAHDNAAVGEIGVDVGAAIQQADTAFDQFKKADRQAAVAEKDSAVRLKSRFQGRATTLRTVEILVLDNHVSAIAEMGMTEKICEAILSSAREYRKTHGALPAGVTAKTEQTL